MIKPFIADHKLRFGTWSALLVLVFASSSLAATEPRQVLLLHSFDREFAPFDAIEEIFRAELGRQSPEPINFLEFSLQLVRLRVSGDEKPLVEYLQSMFAGRHLDLIVPIGGPATVFAQKYRQLLFPTTPMLVTAVDERFVQTASLTPNDTVVPVAFDAPQNIEGILRLLPATESVYVIVGGSWSEQFWSEELHREFQRFNNRLRFVWFNELSFSELLKQSASLPPHSAIFYVDMALDAKGIPLTDRRTLPELHAVASAPIFGVQSTQLGLGVVGGPVMAIETVARNAATVAVRILSGESPGNIKTATQRPGPPLFDWRELRRWGISENRLPPGSIVQFREPTVLERHGWLITSVSVGFAEGLLIVALLTGQVRRRRAERSQRESEERFRLVANTAPVLICMSGIDKRCTYFNQGWLEFTGQSLEMELGHDWTLGVHPEDVEACLETYTKAFDRHEPFRMEYRLRRHDGEYRWIFSQGVPRFNVDGSLAGYISSGTDVTERHLAEEALSTVSQKLIEAHEEERTRLARELHDDISQRLSLLSLNLQRAKLTPPASAAELDQEIGAAVEEIAYLATDIQALSHRLHSSKLEFLGLAGAAAGFCEELSARHGVEIDFHSENISETLPPGISLSLFRVLQEALQNAIKHSGSRRFQVLLRGRVDDVELTVQDSGVGFDLQQAMRGRGLGLTSMKERLGLVGGQVSIHSELGRGTTIHARVPLSSPTQSACA